MLNEEYSNKYIKSIDENNELYNFLQLSIETNKELLNKKISSLDKDLEYEYTLINEELSKYQQDAINRYREQENIFISKTKNLERNKKINKEELYKIIRSINKKRIGANHKYNSIANDICSKNEQEQLKFKHSNESSIEKNIYDKSVITQEALEKTKNLDEEIKLLESNKRQIISKKEKQISQNTINLNNIITQIGIEYGNRLKYGNIPYEIKSNKLIDEIQDNEETYNNIEEKILTEFKSLLQENDNEIELLRDSHKEVLDAYLASIKKIKKEFNSKLQKEINIIDKKISTAYSNQNPTNKKETVTLIKKLVGEKKEFIKKQNILKHNKIKEIKAIHLEYELDYIAKYEELRSKKSEWEAIKSSAMKNVNYERVYHHERINSELKLVNSEKDSFANQDHYEEIKEIYNKRLEFELDNESIRYEINEIELEIFTDKLQTIHKKDVIEAQKGLNTDLCDVDLEYQNNSIKNRIDYFNVKSMLDIKKESIINEFEKLFATENTEYEKIKYAYYNSCDNIQYQIYKNNNEWASILIDEDVKFHQDLFEAERIRKTAKNDQQKNLLINQHNHQENLLHIQLYEDRLEIEITLLIDLYKTYFQIMKNITDFESKFNELICSLHQSVFEQHKEEIIILLELIRQIKFDILKNYFIKEIQIINMRLNFEKSIKYYKQIETTKNELTNILLESNNKINKINQRIASNENTLLHTVETINSLKKKVFELNIGLITGKIRRTNVLETRKQISNIRENIKLLQKQISANKINIRKLNSLKKRLDEELSKKESMYKLRFEKMQRTQKNEERTYRYLTDLIETQYYKLENFLNLCGQIISSNKYKFNSISNSKTKINEINYEILSYSENYYDVRLNKFETLFKKQYNIQKEIYNKNYQRYCKELKRTINIENKEYQTNITTLTNAHNLTKETLIKQAKHDENKLLNELKKINEEHHNNLKEHQLKMKEISDKKEFELLCHNENCQMHLNHYNENTEKIVNEYMTKIKEIKAKYQQIISQLTFKYSQALKRVKAQQVSDLLLMKNNKTNIKNEYKENTKKTNGKIKKIVQDDKFTKARHEENQKIRYKLYLLNQKNTKKEFFAQTREITKKCNARIAALRKSFKKEFQRKKD